MPRWMNQSRDERRSWWISCMRRWRGKKMLKEGRKRWSWPHQVRRSERDDGRQIDRCGSYIHTYIARPSLSDLSLSIYIYSPRRPSRCWCCCRRRCRKRERGCPAFMDDFAIEPTSWSFVEQPSSRSSRRVWFLICCKWYLGRYRGTACFNGESCPM